MIASDPLADVFPDTLDAPLPVLTNGYEVRTLGRPPRFIPAGSDKRWAPAAPAAPLGQVLVSGLRRAAALQLALVFGGAETRRAAGELASGQLDPAEAARRRAALDDAADRLFGVRR